MPDNNKQLCSKFKEDVAKQNIVLDGLIHASRKLGEILNVLDTSSENIIYSVGDKYNVR